MTSLSLGCSGPGGQTCGAATPAPTEAVLVTIAGEAYSYENFIAGANNDCPFDGGFPPPDNVSITVYGTQPDTGFAFTVCLRQPKLITDAPISLSDLEMIELQDVNARRADGCDYRIFPGSVPTGTATVEGFCTLAGGDYNLAVSGSIGGIRRCPQDAGLPVEEQVTLMLEGKVLVHVAVDPESGWKPAR
jgi:hypothetical protein